MATPKTEVWYVWKELVTVEGEDESRLLTPWSDPSLYEYPMDWLFESPEAAYASKEEQAPDEDWILCKETLEPLR